MADLKELVHEALGNAMDNGYDELLDETDEYIAHDLGCYDADLEDVPFEELLPHIRSFRAARRQG